MKSLYPPPFTFRFLSMKQSLFFLSFFFWLLLDLKFWFSKLTQQTLLKNFEYRIAFLWGYSLFSWVITNMIILRDIFGQSFVLVFTSGVKFIIYCSHRVSAITLLWNHSIFYIFYLLLIHLLFYRDSDLVFTLKDTGEAFTTYQFVQHHLEAILWLVCTLPIFYPLIVVLSNLLMNLDKIMLMLYYKVSLDQCSFFFWNRELLNRKFELITPRWACSLTGKQNLTFQEAIEVCLSTIWRDKSVMCRLSLFYFIYIYIFYYKTNNNKWIKYQVHYFSSIVSKDSHMFCRWVN